MQTRESTSSLSGPTLPPVGFDLRLAVIVSLVVLLGAPPFLFGYLSRYTQNPDPFIYAQVAKEVLSGRRLYTETWQDKPPLAYVAYALPQLVVPRSYGAIAIFGGICVAITGALYAYLFRGNPAAMLAVALFLSLFPMTYWDYTWPSTELFANVFVAGNLLLALAIYRDKRFSLVQCALVGVLACLAFHVRQNTVFCALIPALAVWKARPPRRTLVFALGATLFGALAAWIVILALLVRVGDLNMYFWTVFVYSRSFAAVGSYAEFVQLWWHLWMSPLPVIIALFACLAASRRQDTLFVVSIVSVGLLAASCPLRVHAHYWACSFPYVALLIGIGMQRVSEIAGRLAWNLTIALALVLLPATVLQVAMSTAYYDRYDKFAVLAETVDRLVPGDGTLFVCGRGQMEAVQFASRLRAANTFEWTFQFREPWVGILPTPLEEIIEQYLASPPDVIVAARDLVALAATEPEPNGLTGDVRLLAALTKRHRYTVVDEQGDFVIALRTPVP